jgi:hypothetical protein
MSRAHAAPVLLTLAAFATLAPAAFGAAGTVLLQDDFEAYADTPAMQANWGSGGLGTLDNSQGSNAMSHPGGTDNIRTFNDAGVLPTDAAPIVWQFDYYFDDDPNGTKRLTMGLRDDGNGNPLGALLELGYYNSAYNAASETDPNVPAGGSGLAYRVALLSGADSTPSQLAGYNGWNLFLNSDATDKLSLSGQHNSWMTFKATIYPTSIDFAVDLGRDGTWDSTGSVLDVDSSNIAYNSARFGGPSSLASAGGGALLDNVLIQTAPSHNPGDTNNDGVVDLTDLNNVLNNFGVAGTGNPGDDDGSGTVDLTDLNNVLNNFGITYAAAALNVVPEPASLSLLAIGVTALLTRRRRA